MAFVKQRRPANGMNPSIGNNVLDRNPAPAPEGMFAVPQQIPTNNQSDPSSIRRNPNPQNGVQFRQPSNQPAPPQDPCQHPQEQYRQHNGDQPSRNQRQIPNRPNPPQHTNAVPPASPQTAPHTDSLADESSYMSCKIWKINGNKKVIDFTSNLIQAKPKDFANIHGIGGSGHAPNSTISISLCDYTKGTGKDHSLTVRYNVDVEDMEMLYNAAMAARLGLLKMLPPLNPGNSNCTFAHIKQKSNPYQKSTINGETYVPASTLEILYDPSRNYPWIIQITNCLAPLIVKANGASNHEASRAINQTKTNIFVSADDFCSAMVAVKRFVRLWEQRMYRTVDAECRRYEAYLEEKNKQNHAG